MLRFKTLEDSNSNISTCCGAAVCNRSVCWLLLPVLGICMQEDFDSAAERIKPVTGPNNDEMLELYGLFKQATVGDNTTRESCWQSDRLATLILPTAAVDQPKPQFTHQVAAV